MDTDFIMKMADPYQDENEDDTEYFGVQEKKPFFQAFQQVGQTIRDGGFCSPNGKSPKTRASADNVPDSEDSAHKVKTVTFSDHGKFQY